ncbi:MAG TPA: glutamate racemase [Chitinophagaceae bacterium]|nr:glutamate racemase [Chitinophagaceae bacterium]
MQITQPIGIFDSGYGGLTIMKEIVKLLPDYDYIYLGDNARAPYGTRSFDSVYRYTWQCVQWFFKQNCSLVILACNTASAKALRTIQQNDLPKVDSGKRVLGVIRPTSEVIGNYSDSKAIGILATSGTVNSQSYPIEIKKFFPGLKVYQQACPMWVPLIENNEYHTKGADFFVKKYINELLAQSSAIDTLLLACTHYPLMMDKIKEYSPADITILSQGEIVAISLKDYLSRHSEMEVKLSQNAIRHFYTTDSTGDFDSHARLFYGDQIISKHVDLEA